VVIRNNERKRKNERKRNNEREITITWDTDTQGRMSVGLWKDEEGTIPQSVSQIRRDRNVTDVTGQIHVNSKETKMRYGLSSAVGHPSKWFEPAWPRGNCAKRDSGMCPDQLDTPYNQDDCIM
jgi:hypothetical protein